MRKTKEIVALLHLAAYGTAIYQLFGHAKWNGILIGGIFLLGFIWIMIQGVIHIQKHGFDLLRDSEEVATEALEEGKSRLQIRLERCLEIGYLAIGCFYMIWIEPQFIEVGITLATLTVTQHALDFFDGSGPGRKLLSRLSAGTGDRRDGGPWRRIAQIDL